MPGCSPGSRGRAGRGNSGLGGRRLLHHANHLGQQVDLLTRVEHLSNVDVGDLVVLAGKELHDRLVLRIVGKRCGWLGHEMLDPTPDADYGLRRQPRQTRARGRRAISGSLTT